MKYFDVEMRVTTVSVYRLRVQAKGITEAQARATYLASLRIPITTGESLTVHRDASEFEFPEYGTKESPGT